MQMNKEIFAQTDRLVLRKFNRNDYLNLCGILQDEKAMYATRALFRTAKCRHGSIISSAATAKRASGYTQSSSKTAADVLVFMALIASICIGEIFAAGEIAFIMQLGALLEELTVARAQPRSRQR